MKLSTIFSPAARRIVGFRITQSLQRRKPSSATTEEHAEALIEWLMKAQRATPDDGVAESFYLPSNAWNASYPETTGYIVCSMLRAADVGLGNVEQIRDSARRMGTWLTTTQLDDGSFPGGPVSIKNPKPALFNTGQILKGLTDLIKQEIEDTSPLRISAERAARWMVKNQDEDGAWRRGLSVLANSPVRAYNVRAAWGLARYGLQVEDTPSVESGIQNGEWLMSQRQNDGWFKYMNFDDGHDPLTHTVAYTIRGLLELGVCCNRTDFVEAAEFAALRMSRLQSSDGSIPGKIAPGYRAAVTWTNTTGLAQMAIVWFRLAQLTGDTIWRKAGQKANEFNKSLHTMTHSNAAIQGALQGSYPGHMGYGRYWYMNWTQKFFLDSLLAELGCSVD